MSSKKRAPLRRALGIGGRILGVLVVCLLALRGLQALGGRVPMIEVTGPERVEGRLRIAPIRFAQTDFWFYPSRVEAEVGYLKVPARRNHPADETLEIRFVRFPATGGASEVPPTVYLAGGPGGSGVETASGDRFGFFMKLREAGDVIALDQRGTHGSDPFPVCPGAWSYPLDRVVGESERALALEPVLRECWSHWSERLHPGSFTSVENAADLDDLRAALGAERLNLVGISYGTHLALAYIRRYPDRVARAVLAGVEGPDHTYKRPAMVDGIVREIARTLEVEAGWEGFVTDIESALERLEREQPVVTIEDPSTKSDVDVKLGPVDLKTAVYFGLGEREDFRKVARRVRRIARGDDELLAKYTLRARKGGSPMVMSLSMDCASGASPERLDLITREAQDALIGDVVNLSLTTVCPFWPVEDLGDAFRSPLQSSVPILAVSGTLDPRTPPSNADEILAGFPSGLHLKIVGAGHGDDLLIATPEIGEAMVRFLRTGDAGTELIALPPL